MKKVRLLLLIFLLVGISIISAAAQVQVPPQISDTAQHYPITSTPNWVEMDRTDRVAACQLSKESTAKMSTEELLQAVLSYPFIIDLYAFDTDRAGFEHVYREFPALAELTRRADFGIVLTDFYRSIPAEHAYTVSGDANCQNAIFLSTIKILIAQDEVTSRLDEATIHLLSQIAEEKNPERTHPLDTSCKALTTCGDVLGSNSASPLP